MKITEKFDRRLDLGRAVIVENVYWITGHKNCISLTFTLLTWRESGVQTVSVGLILSSCINLYFFSV